MRVFKKTKHVIIVIIGLLLKPSDYLKRNGKNFTVYIE